MNQDDMARKMRDAQSSLMKMQQDMGKMQAELSAIMIEGTAGGGAVIVVCNGNSEFRSVKIKKEAIDLDDISLLEDSILAAIKDATNKAQQLLQQRANSLTAGLNLPPGLF